MNAGRQFQQSKPKKMATITLEWEKAEIYLAMQSAIQSSSLETPYCATIYEQVASQHTA